MLIHTCLNTQISAAVLVLAASNILCFVSSLGLHIDEEATSCVRSGTVQTKGENYAIKVVPCSLYAKEITTGTFRFLAKLGGCGFARRALIPAARWHRLAEEIVAVPQ